VKKLKHLLDFVLALALDALLERPYSHEMMIPLQEKLHLVPMKNN
jgi:hypothetical protein